MADSDAKELVAHADFAGPADVTLVSCDGTAFHIASSHLASASAWFRTLFSVPQGDEHLEEHAQCVALSEDTLTLEILLKICCGRAPGLAKLDNVSALDRCLRAAEKYEVAAALELLPLLLHKARMQKDPLRLYALAGRYAQDDVAASALHRLMTMRLNFNKMNVLESWQLRALFAQRQERIEKFCSLLVQEDVAAPFYAENTTFCTRSLRQTGNNYHNRVNPQTWTSLVVVLQAAFIKQPSVDALETDEGVKARLASLESAKCGYGGCNVLQYEWRDIRLRLLKAVDGV